MSRLSRFALTFLSIAGSALAADETASTPRTSKAVSTEITDLLERFVNWLHHFCPDIDDGLFHWLACGIIIIAAILLRHIITDIIFNRLKKLASKAESTLDDKLFPAMEAPVAALIMVAGIFAAISVLQLPPRTDLLVTEAAKVCVLAVVLWGAIRGGGAVLDHLEEISHQRQMTVATFMPLIKKTLMVFAIICGVLMIADSLGLKVGVFLTSLGIGGLAFALAAQDTIANLFGSLVVVLDQPFRVGDVVKIGAQVGTVEDIGLRSTKIRLVDRSVAIMPNKMVASEAVVNLSRVTERRVEQNIALPYDTSPAQMEAILAEIRELIRKEAEINQDSVVVAFHNIGVSSLEILVAYMTVGPDFMAQLRLKERLNLAFMRAVTARGLSFALPAQSLHLPGPVLDKLADRK